MSNFEWLLHEATASRPIQVGERTIMDNESWRATIERLEIGPGLRVFLTDAQVRQDVTVQPSDKETVPWLANYMAVVGRAEIEMPDGLRTASGSDQALMFRPSARNPRFHHSGPQHLRASGWTLRDDRIERVFGGDVPAVIRPLLEPEVRRSLILELRASRRLRTLAEGLFAPGLNGPLRILFMEGTVLQLLATMAAAAGKLAPRPRAELSARERRAVLEARERLLADMRNPPTVGELAAAVGLSEKRLTQAFRACFGGTVFSVLRSHRLEHARLALEDPGLSLKEVAFRVGYNHPTNFINAFTARYGAPPRRYIEGQPEESE